MSPSSDTWFTTTVADSPTLRMLLGDIRDHVRRARLCGRLHPEARIYAVTEPDYVRLWVNQPAQDSLDVFRRVPLRPDRRPAPRECVNALIDPPDAVSFAPLPPVAATHGGAGAPQR